MDSALQWRWIEFLHPDDRDRTVAGWREAIARRQLFETEFRFRQVDGSFKWRRVQAMPILDDEANVKEWLGVNVDIERNEDLRGARASRLTGAQIRAARGLLKWSVMDLPKILEFPARSSGAWRRSMVLLRQTNRRFR